MSLDSSGDDRAKDGWIASAKKECEDILIVLVKMSSPTMGADGKRTYEKYLCLPDTVDPRTPKRAPR